MSCQSSTSEQPKKNIVCDNLVGMMVLSSDIRRYLNGM